MPGTASTPPPPLRRPAPARRAFTTVLLAFGLLTAPGARADASKEYDLKAVLLYHFTQFVEWPPTASPRPDAPIVIGILGRDPFGQVLDELVRQESREHRRIVVERYRGPDAIGNCQILFIDSSESRNLPRILAALKGRPVLTVGDSEDFAIRGGMIRFMKGPDDRISLRINLAAAKAGGLTISSRLLRVADIVTTQK